MRRFSPRTNTSIIRICKQQRIQGEIARLLAGDADIYGELLGRYADLDLQHLRQLVREAQKLLAAATAEVDDDAPAAPSNAPNKYQRRLQKYLQGLALFYEE